MEQSLTEINRRRTLHAERSCERRKTRVREWKRSFPKLFTRVELLSSVRVADGNDAVEELEDA